MKDDIDPAVLKGVAMCREKCPRYRKFEIVSGAHDPRGECSLSNRSEAYCVPWYRARIAELEELFEQLEQVRAVAERSDKYGEQSLAIREILAILNGLTCCKGEYNHCPECGGHRRLDEDTWVCDHCRNKRLPAPLKEE